MIFENKIFEFFQEENDIFGGFLGPQTHFLKIWHVFNDCIWYGPKIIKIDLILRDFLKIYPKSEKNMSKLEQFS